MRINIFYDEVKFRLRGAGIVKVLVSKIITQKGRSTGDINIIFTSGEKLLELNREFLKHNYYTDVITFSDNKDDFINGEIYISIDDVKMNSINYNERKYDEIFRVIIHGVLHLCGHDDSTDELRKIMRMEENKWLNYKRNMRE